MEFNFNVNSILHEDITVLDTGTIRDPHYSNHMKNIEVILSEIGKRSAKAQNLPGPITNLTKMMVHQQRIYILKDADAHNGCGIVLGFLKTGRKKLFLIDHDGKHNEECPLCVLDFYVHESHQRRGFGLKLFKFMIKTENISTVELAVDRPSSKFTAFLRKHFNLWANIPQVNNFVIFEGFFKRKRSSDYSNQRRCLLSRAASDDIIKRNRQNLYHMNGGEPHHRPFHDKNNNFIEAELFPTRQGSSYGRQQRLEPNVKQNLYSRYNNKQPSYVSQRKVQSATDRENVEPDISSPEPAKSPVQQIRQSPIQQKVEARPPSNRKTIHRTQSPEVERNDMNKTSPVEERTYETPSDMISELRQRDSENMTPSRRTRRGYQFYSTSWNVFGVPPLQMRR